MDQIPISLREKPKLEVVIPLVMALHGHLQEIHRNLSSDLRQNDILLLFLYSVKLLVDEIEFNSRDPDLGKVSPDANASIATQMQRLECLHRCLDSVGERCGVFFSMTSDVYFELPFSIVSYQLGRSLKMLSNLTFLREPGWDCNEVRAKVDLFEAINNVASGLEKVQDLLDGDDGVEELSVKKLCRALRINKSTVQAEFLSRQQRNSTYAGAEEEQQSLPEMVFNSAGYPLNFLFEDQ